LILESISVFFRILNEGKSVLCKRSAHHPAAGDLQLLQPAGNHCRGHAAGLAGPELRHRPAAGEGANLILNSSALSDYNASVGGGYERDLGEIKVHEPNIFEQYSHTAAGSSLPGRILYGVADDFWVTLCCMTVGHSNAFHLNGAGTIGDETVTSGINTMTNFIPMDKFFGFAGMGDKTLNAGQFNSLYKGTGITAATDGGRNILLYNNAVRSAAAFGPVWTGITIISLIGTYY